MDTRASENRRIVLSIREEAQTNKLFEALLEAAPQFILQLSILLQTGHIGNFLIKLNYLKMQDSVSNYYLVLIDLIQI